MIDIRPLAIPEIKLIVPKVFSDARGWFSETYSRRVLAEAGIDAPFVQDNQSLSVKPGTVRALHFQSPPHAQGKLVRVVSGSIFDVALDLRLGSPTYGRHVEAVLSAANGAQLWVPEGFAHGFCTLEARTIVIYKTTAFYAPQHERGIIWNDPVLGIVWPVQANEALLSEKDLELPALRDLAPTFRYP